MSDSDLSATSNFTSDAAKQLPDHELKLGHEQAEREADSETGTDAATEAERKLEVSEEELKRRGTSAN